ncbi:MAG TPA: L-fucose mutarotase [Lentisphaeria bacterium]|nr:MAG: fucose isomerase [Lentisphaerae bacterium GWF2_50_93]HCE43237.1 L-fucose mutarotase [Lentisphaeria bacterium]
MLKGISPLLSPELLATLCRMGHGDEIVFADAHFPGHSLCSNVIRADGLKIPEMLDAVLPLFELDSYVDSPVVMMQEMKCDNPDPAIGSSYASVIRKHAPAAPGIERIDKFEFYGRTKTAFAVVMTGDTAKYANVLLKKGVTPL